MNVVDQEITDQYAIYCGDSAEVLAGIPDQSIGLSVYSPPFQSLYTYSPSERDLGNSHDSTLFWTHYGFITRELLRVTKPGRHTCVHVQQIATTMVNHGEIAVQDFRGDVIRHYQEHGWIYHGEVCIDKDPQAQAIRTKSKSLLFVQLRRDASWMRPALADYIIIMRAPGENREVIQPTPQEVSNEEWIQWARPIWYGIRESGTLNAASARSEDDERHIAPLQLETIERCVRLWSNPGDTVLTPFMGIGSEVVTAIKHGRKGIGIELKPEYYAQARKNIARALAENTLPLFADLEVPA
jgi:DNA modification methylase